MSEESKRDGYYYKHTQHIVEYKKGEEEEEEGEFECYKNDILIKKGERGYRCRTSNYDWMSDEYLTDGRVFEEWTYFLKGKYEEWYESGTRKCINHFDDDGNLIDKVYWYPDGMLQKMTWYKEGFGDYIQEEYKWNGNGQLIEHYNDKYHKKWDNNGKLVKHYDEVNKINII